MATNIMSNQLRLKLLAASTLVLTTSLLGCSSNEPLKADETTSTSTSSTPPAQARSQASGNSAPASTGGTSGVAQSSTPPIAGSAGRSTSAGASGAVATAGVGGDAAASSDDAGVTDVPPSDVPPKRSNREPLSGRAYPTMQEFVMDAPMFRITRPTDLGVTGSPLPVVVWANGGCLRSDIAWTTVFEHWAKAGFVVFSLTSPGGDNDLAGMFSQTTKAEQAALLEWVVKANESGPFAGALDLERVVAAGNSCGGVTSLELTASDKRIAAVFVLSGSSAVGSVDEAIMKAISVPVGYITGSESEDVAAPNAAADYEAMQPGIAAMLMQRTSGDHITVSSDPAVQKDNAEISLNWLDLALYGTKHALDTLTAPQKVCATCTPDIWKLKAKNLESLVK